jgi:hypothetical protein
VEKIAPEAETTEGKGTQPQTQDEGAAGNEEYEEEKFNDKVSRLLLSLL